MAPPPQTPWLWPSYSPKVRLQPAASRGKSLQIFSCSLSISVSPPKTVGGPSTSFLLPVAEKFLKRKHLPIPTRNWKHHRRGRSATNLAGNSDLTSWRFSNRFTNHG